MKRSRIGLVVLVAILFVIGGVTYVVLGDQAPKSQCPEGEEALVTVSGAITAASGSTPGQLSLRVLDSACEPVAGVEIATVSPTLSGVANTTFVSYGGSTVSGTNPLPSGQAASGQLPVNGVTAGQRYTLTVEVSFASGAVPETLTLVLISQPVSG
ncbi:MAG: hypothetical protein ABSF83_01985 [Nitrososphaerales archaeon]|jgi:hypothetical protein